MTRKILLGALLLASQISVVAVDAADADKNIAQKAYGFVKSHVVESSAALILAAIIARPVVLWAKDYLTKKECSCYALDSIAGASVEKKDDGRVKFRVHVGSVDGKVVVPTGKVFPLGEKKRSASALLDSFRPHLEFGIDDKTTPLISDETLVDTPKVKRVYAKFSLGPWSARMACDVADLVIVPAALIAMQLIAEYMPSAVVSGPVDPAV